MTLKNKNNTYQLFLLKQIDLIFLKKNDQNRPQKLENQNERIL